ncbi:MAG: hypothetical protein Q8P99_00045 [bacterium]|nr:hypothetical protein [bacterium]MDZ4231554.1 hypothetical protein [Patescibacteria group bacterium]
MRKTLLQWINENPGYVSTVAFFLWGALIALSAPVMASWWALPILLVAYVISGAGIYFGYLKNKEGKRSVLGIVLGVVTMLYNLSLSALYLLI